MKDNILIMAVLAVGAFFLLRGNDSKAGGTVAARLGRLPVGALFLGSDGEEYITAQRPASSFETYASGGVINMANSEQIIRPANALDSIGGYYL
ncbi:MAG: hypothetical protein Q7U78_05895 [Gallionella sp.]|nr:hypothetical protein [Gallionella sp.]